MIRFEQPRMRPRFNTFGETVLVAYDGSMRSQEWFDLHIERARVGAYGDAEAFAFLAGDSVSSIPRIAPERLEALEEGDAFIHEGHWGTWDIGIRQIYYLLVRRTGDMLEWGAVIEREHEGYTTQTIRNDLGWMIQMPFRAACEAYREGIDELADLRELVDHIKRCERGDWDQWARSPHRGIRRLLARHARTPDRILTLLSRTDPNLQRDLMARKTLPQKVFAPIMESTIRWTEDALSHPDAPTSFLETVSRQSDGASKELALHKLASRAVAGAVDLEDAFGELRSFFQEKPSTQRWAFLLEMMEEALEKQPDAVATTWVPYANRELEAWSSFSREVPHRWLREANERGELSPLWELARRAQISSFHRDKTLLWEAIATSPHLSRLKHFTMQCVDEQSISALSRANLSGVTWFSLQGAYHDRCSPLASTTALFRAPWFQHLEELWFFDTKLSAANVEALASANFERLNKLVLSAAALDGEMIAKLLDSPWLANLRALCFNDNATEGALGALASVDFTRLEVLDLSRESLDFDTLERLLDAPWMMRLRELNLDYNEGLGDRMVDALIARKEKLPALEQVRMSTTDISEAAWARLIEDEHFSSMRLSSSRGHH